MTVNPWLLVLLVLALPGTWGFVRDMIAFHRNPSNDPFLFRCGWAATIIFVLVVGGCLIGMVLSG